MTSLSILKLGARAGLALAAIASAGIASAQPATPPVEGPPNSTPAETTQQAAPAPAAGPVPCPPCPPGQACQNGACVPAVYPICAPGYRFDGYYCVPMGYWQPPPEDYRDPEEERALALRLANRLRGRFTIDLQGGAGLLGTEQWASRTSLVAPTGFALLGYRRNYRPKVGALFRGGVMLGVPIFSYRPPTASSSSESDEDSTSMFGLVGEAGPFFGPFGRFYFGPTLWAGYATFGEKELRAGPTGYGFHLSDGAMYGLGGTGGVLVGAREQVDITFSCRLDLNPDHGTTIFLLGGVGFHR